MSEPTATPEETPHRAHVVVHGAAPGPRPYRTVEILGNRVGKAYSLADVEELCRRAGLEVDPTDPANVTWEDGGPDDWSV
jgi:hypothetical protein